MYVCDYLSNCFEKSLKLHEGSYFSIFIVACVFLPVMVYKFPFQTEAQYHSRAGTFWFEGQGSSRTQSPVLVASLSSFLWSTSDWTLPGNHRAGKIMEDHELFHIIAIDDPTIRPNDWQLCSSYSWSFDMPLNKRHYVSPQPVFKPLWQKNKDKTRSEWSGVITKWTITRSIEGTQ